MNFAVQSVRKRASHDLFFKCLVEKKVCNDPQTSNMVRDVILFKSFPRRFFNCLNFVTL